MSTYMNQAGAGDYDLPNLTGNEIFHSMRRNCPTYSFQSRTRLSWFPQHKVEFLGRSSPPVTKYRPTNDNNRFKNLKYSVGKKERFSIPTSINLLNEKIPHYYSKLVRPGS